MYVAPNAQVSCTQVSFYIDLFSVCGFSALYILPPKKTTVGRSRSTPCLNSSLHLHYSDRFFTIFQNTEKDSRENTYIYIYYHHHHPSPSPITITITIAITLIVLTNENSVRKTLANYSFRIGFMYIIYDYRCAL